MSVSAPGLIRCYLAVAMMDLLPRAIGFRRTLDLIRRMVPDRGAVTDPSLIEATSQRIALAAAFHPRRALCLEQSLALHLLLRRRGVPSELRLGVQARPFYAHAWVEVEGRAVNEQADLPMRMATFAGIGG